MAAPEGNQFWKLRAKHGRDKIYATEADLLADCYEYFQWCDDNPWVKNEAIKSGDRAGEIISIPTARPYTLSGLCIYLGISNETWKDYSRRKDFVVVTARVEDIIRTQKFEGAAVGVFNANIMVRDLGLADKQEHVGKGDTELFKEKSDEELLTMLKEISSKLDG
jgi:DNA-packaging protein gp3